MHRYPLIVLGISIDSLIVTCLLHETPRTRPLKRLPNHVQQLQLQQLLGDI